MKFAVLLLMIFSILVFVLYASDEKKDDSAQKKDDSKEMVMKIEVKLAGNQTICPVTGNKVDPKIFVDYQGNRIKFCGATCEVKFLKAPEDGFKKLADAKETVDNTQTKCPVSDDVLENHNLFIEKPGRKIYFCCNDCPPDFKKDESKFLNKMPGVKVKDGVKVNAEAKK